MSQTKLKRYHHSVMKFMAIAKQQAAMSYATQHDRKHRLMDMGQTLYHLGYKVSAIDKLKPKHITILIQHWQQSNLSVGTIKNRLADIRFTCKILKRPHVVKENNQAYGLGGRPAQSAKNRAIDIKAFSMIKDNPYLRCTLELQRVFGLRREEAIKIKPHIADKGGRLILQPSWTKGGIGRPIPIITSEQRYWLEQAKSLVKTSDSLIPKERTYIQQRHAYDWAVRHTLKMKNLHGLRHAYAQERYRQITQCEPPITAKKDYIRPQNDQEARQIISKELGHSRVEVTKVYLG